MTNGDLVRQMDNSRLAELWSRTYFPDRYHADCNTCGKIHHCDFMAQACPDTFKNWLDASCSEIPSSREEWK